MYFTFRNASFSSKENKLCNLTQWTIFLNCNWRHFFKSRIYWNLHYSCQFWDDLQLKFLNVFWSELNAIYKVFQDDFKLSRLDFKGCELTKLTKTVLDKTKLHVFIFALKRVSKNKKFCRSIICLVNQLKITPEKSSYYLPMTKSRLATMLGSTRTIFWMKNYFLLF